jgi:hypothetical protein
MTDEQLKRCIRLSAYAKAKGATSAQIVRARKGGLIEAEYLEGLGIWVIDPTDPKNEAWISGSPVAAYAKGGRRLRHIFLSDKEWSDLRVQLPTLVPQAIEPTREWHEWRVKQAEETGRPMPKHDLFPDVEPTQAVGEMYWYDAEGELHTDPRTVNAPNAPTKKVGKRKPVDNPFEEFLKA